MESEDKAGEYHRGLRAFRNNEFNEAVKHLSAAVEYDENNDKAWNALGIACSKVGRFADADLCFENALTLSPDNQVYLKNRRTNEKNLKERIIRDTPSNSLLERLSLDRIPFERIPLEPKYIFTGVIGIIMLLILGIFILSGGSSNTSNLSSGPDVSISVRVTNTDIILTNEGGKDLPLFKSFTLKVDGNPIGSGKPDDPANLGITNGSYVSIPFSALTNSNFSNGLNLQVIGNYQEGGEILVHSEHIQPVIQAQAASEIITPAPTPTIPPYLPQFREGQVLVDQSGTYWLILTPPLNETYNLSKAARTPGGTFVPIDTKYTTYDVKKFEGSAHTVGYSFEGGTPPGLPGLTPPPTTGVSILHPEPIYVAGNLINSVKNGNSDMIVVLGYDQKSDNYQADDLHRYYSGEWGYRDDRTPKWYLRETMERQFPYRIGRIALSDIGIGSDSAPPRSRVQYSPGDIISSDIGGTDKLQIILAYNSADDRYSVGTIKPSYGGGWYRPNTSYSEKRAFIERDYPYKIRTVNLELIKII